MAPVSGTHSVATDRRRQQTTNPCLGLQNKDKGFSLPPSHSLLSSLLLSVLLPLPPSQPVTQPATSSLLSNLHTHTHTHTHLGPYGEAWLLPLSPRLSPLSAPGRGERISMPPNRFKNALYSLTLSRHTSCFVLRPLWSSTICWAE